MKIAIVWFPQIVPVICRIDRSAKDSESNEVATGVSVYFQFWAFKIHTFRQIFLFLDPIGSLDFTLLIIDKLVCVL